MALSSIRIFAGTLVPIAMCIRFIKMVVSENPPGGAWGATVAHRLLFLKEKQACWNIEHTLSMFLHTWFLPHEDLQYSKIFKQNKREWNREKKERWPPLGTLWFATRHSDIHPLLSIKIFTFDCFVESSTEATDHILCKLRKKGNSHLSYNIYFFFAAI